MNSKNPVKTRKMEWDLTPLYDSDTDGKIDSDIKTSEQEIIKFTSKWKNRSDYLENPKILKEALDEYERWAEKYGIAGSANYYLGLRSALEQSNPDLKAKINKLSEKSVEMGNEIQFFMLGVSKIPKEKQEAFLKSDDLKEYRHLLEILFIQGKYTLTDAEEKILNITAKTAFDNWVNMVSELLSKEILEVIDSDGKLVKLPFNEALALISSENKEIRTKSAEEIEKVFLKHLDVIEIEMNTVLEDKTAMDKLRGYKRYDESRHVEDDIETEVVDKLIKAVEEKFYIAKKYYDFKAKLLGQEKLKYFERSVEYGSLKEKYPFDKSVELVFESLTKLDNEFAEIFKKFIDNGQIDVFPKAGKSGGAFCTHGTKLMPTYILLNHTDRFNDVLTIAHEVGHGINNELIKQAQNELNFDTPTSTAEVASTFVEDFVLEKLYENVSDEEKLSIRMMKLDSDISTIFRQAAFYLFESSLHKKFREKGYLTAVEIGQMFKEKMSAYMGGASEGSENWWTYVSHFRNYFYVYSYASGLLISKYLQTKVRDGASFIDNVKVFLSAGISKSPKNIFSEMGIDIADKTFWQIGLVEVEKYLDDTISLAKRLKKL